MTNRFLIWRPQQTAVVLGSSNKVEDAIHILAVKKAGLPVYRRPSGGQAVILSVNTLVISLVERRRRWEPVDQLFRAYNRIVIRVLDSLKVRGIQEAGFSDITINGKKICGSAMYQNREQIVFHAVLNVKESSDLIEKYLKYPERQPDYRSGRSHSDFVTSLFEQGFFIDFPVIENAFGRQLRADFS